MQWSGDFSSGPRRPNLQWVAPFKYICIYILIILHFHWLRKTIPLQPVLAELFSPVRPSPKPSKPSAPTLAARGFGPGLGPRCCCC